MAEVKKFILIPGRIHAEDPEGVFILPTKKPYACATHPKKPAFCMCAKCGAMLCQNCCIPIGGRQFCENCLIQDDSLIASYEKEIIRPRLHPNDAAVCTAPMRIADIPRAILNMLKDSAVFFRTAKAASFPLTFGMAFCAMLPNAVCRFVFRLEETLPKETFKEFGPIIQTMPDYVLAFLAVIMTAMQILLLDLLLFGCIRIFTHSPMTFTETGSVLHFCLLPLFFTVFATYYEVPVVAVCALVLMIVQTTTAARVATECTTLQGLGVMLSFIFASTLLGIL